MRSVPSRTAAAPAARSLNARLRAPAAMRAGALAAVLAVGLAGCGGDDDKPEGTSAAAQAPAAQSAEAPAIQATNSAAFEAVKAKDGAAFCALLTKETVKLLTSGSQFKGSSQSQCAKVATKIAEGIKPEDFTPQKLDDIQVDGNVATGTSGDRVTRFEKVDGKWLVGTSQEPPPNATTPTTTP